MYLLDAKNFTLHGFSEPNIPQYAILSHRWDTVEISFADIQNNTDVQKTAAFSKIRGCCTQAIEDGWSYVWIDSCCIDKSSSSELSEAINSMFSFYSKAQVCYAYLSDVPADTDGLVSGGSRASQEMLTKQSKVRPFPSLSFAEVSGLCEDGPFRNY